MAVDPPLDDSEGIVVDRPPENDEVGSSELCIGVTRSGIRRAFSGTVIRMTWRGRHLGDPMAWFMNPRSTWGGDPVRLWHRTIEFPPHPTLTDEKGFVDFQIVEGHSIKVYWREVRRDPKRYDVWRAREKLSEVTTSYSSYQEDEKSWRKRMGMGL